MAMVKDKLIKYGFVMIIMTYLAAPCGAQEKPSPYVINMIVTRIVMQEVSKIDTREINDIKIVKESQQNSRYFVEVSYNRISQKGEIHPEKGKFFIEKKGDLWIGGKY